MAGNIIQKVRRKKISSKTTLLRGAGLPLNRLRRTEDRIPGVPKEVAEGDHPDEQQDVFRGLLSVGLEQPGGHLALGSSIGPRVVLGIQQGHHLEVGSVNLEGTIPEPSYTNTNLKSYQVAETIAIGNLVNHYETTIRVPNWG